MRTCPKCGNRYAESVDVCPNDDTPLGAEPTQDSAAPAPSAPPTGTKPQPRPKPAPTKPQPSTPADWSTDIGGLREKSSASGWIFMLVGSLILLGGYAVARDFLNPPAETEVASADESVEDGKKKKKKKRKRGKRKRRGRTQGSQGDDRLNFEDYDWEQDFVSDDREFGDIMGERDEVYEEVDVIEPEPYQPSKNEWDPGPGYKPVASYSERGAEKEVIELDLTSGGGGAPLTDDQVNRVLDERRLMPCYDEWVDRIPQMKGRVHMRFVVASDGHVAKVKLTRSQLKSRVVEKCLVDRARRFKFPATSGGRSTKFDTHFDFTNR